MSVLTVNGLDTSYVKLRVLNDISFSINKGDIIGLVGPSGVGKPTLMRTVLNLEKKRAASL